jgi:hypothetical protein
VSKCYAPQLPRQFQFGGVPPVLARLIRRMREEYSALCQHEIEEYCGARDLIAYTFSR